MHFKRAYNSCMQIRLLLATFALLASSAFAADIDGKWAGSVDTPNGPVNVGYTFKADGAALTGTTIGPDGMEVKISNGKIDGAKLSFDVALDFGGMPFTLSYTGVLAGDTLTLTADFGGMPFEIKVKKA